MTRKRVGDVVPSSATPGISRAADSVMNLAAFTSSWTAVALAGWNVVDFLLPVAFVLCLLARGVEDRTVYLHGWMIAPTAATLVVCAVDALFGDGNGDLQMLLRVFLTTAVVSVILTSSAKNGGRSALARVLRWWAAGVALNSLAAVLVVVGYLSFEGVLVQATGSRLSGLSSHPNSIAFSIALAIPALVLLCAHARSVWGRLAWVASTAVSCWALILADSRAGYIVGFPLLFAAILAHLVRSKAKLMLIPALLVATVVAIIYLPPVVAGSRLSVGGELSNAERQRINSVALDLIIDHPFVGSGFNAQIGVSVPLTVLTAGGLLLALGYYSFALKPVPILWGRRASIIAQTGLLTLAAFLLFGLFNPVFMERATYWPVLACALWLGVDEKGASQSPWSLRPTPVPR